MRFGFQFSAFDWPGGPAEIGTRLAESARILDEAGAETLFLMDHFFHLEPYFPVDAPILEGYTGLGFLAGHTRRARLGLLVTGVTYRHPGVLAKTVSTLDVLSGGRATLGIGAAWYEREHVGLGIPFPPVAERFERLEETIQICGQMWSGEAKPYQGRHYQLAETLNRPGPLGRIPILIGGTGERKTLRLVARYADACNLFASSPEEVAHKLDVMRGHCEAEDRDYDSIGKTMMMSTSTEDPDTFLAALAPYRDLGIDTVYTAAKDDPVAFAERFATGFAPRLADF
ncbi:MAG: LLM class F420-dependent oxidoreductase [Actinomycetota bacterium]|nr:LLM class F420-dependent oxidoreductase [Actinomycetota bacterium]